MLLGRVARVGQVVGEGSARRDGPALERVDLEKGALTDGEFAAAKAKLLG